MKTEEYESQHTEWLKADQQVRAEMNLEQEIADSLAKEMADTIDFAMLGSLLNWTQVEMFYHAMGEVDRWLEANCKCCYKRYKDQFIFEDEQDANWFKLRWL